MKIGYETWGHILRECKKSFDEYPILEQVMGRVCKDAVRGHIKSERKLFVKTIALPFWFYFKRIFGFHGKINSLSRTKRKDILDENVKINKCGVFCISTERNNDFGCIFPVLKKFDEMSEKSILLISYKTFRKKRKEIDSLKNCHLIFFENLIDHLRFFELLKAYIEAYQLFKKLIGKTKNEDAIDFIKKHKFEAIFEIEQISISATAISYIIKNKNCKFVFFLGGFAPLIIFGKNQGIKTVMIQHGEFGRVERPDEYGARPPECSPNASDEIIVWGEFAKDQIKEMYNYGNERKIIPLGNPRYDIIVNKYKGMRRSNKFYQNLGLDRNKKTLVHYSGTYAIDHGQPLERYINPVKALDKLYEKLGSKINIVVKLHPYETTKYYKKYMRNSNKIKIVKNEINPYELYNHVDIYTTVVSTTSLEAMIFEINPILQLVLSEYGIRGDIYADYGAGILIKSEEEFIKTVEEIISGKYDFKELKKNQKKYVDYNIANLGHATEKVVNHLLKG